jgi:hypothetical protein
MSDFHFPEWRREMEKAIERAEPIPIRVLLDQAERGFEELERDRDDLQGMWDTGDREVESDAPAGEPA